MSKEKWPPLSNGTSVITTQPNENLRNEWSGGVWERRQWGVQGTIHTHHDSHGLSYEVRHPDGSIGHYDPSEVKEVLKQDEKLSKVSKSDTPKDRGGVFFGGGESTNGRTGSR